MEAPSGEEDGDKFRARLHCVLADYFLQRGFTPFERCYVLGVCSGLTNGEIGHSHGITEASVETYLKNPDSHLGKRPRRKVLHDVASHLLDRLRTAEGK